MAVRQKELRLRILYACVVCARIFVNNVRWQWGIPAVCPDCENKVR